jgi:hypothetical protein
MKCPSCSTDNPATARFCMQCGSPLPGSHTEKANPPKAGAAGDPREIVFQARQVSLDRDSFGNWVITGDNNTITLAPDEAPAAHLRLYYRSLAEDCRQLPLGLVNEEFIRPGVERSLSLTSVYTDLDVVSGLLSEVKGKRRARWFGRRSPWIEILGWKRQKPTFVD